MVLEKLKALGMVKVYSDNLAASVGVSSAVVRKDFSIFGLTGHRRAGYRIDDLLEQLSRILGREHPLKVAIVGCGKIGTALINYRGFEAQGVRIVAGFDVNPSKINPLAVPPVYSMDEFERVVNSEGLRVAILATPENAAARVAERMMAGGIHGILNFAPIPLKGGSTCMVQNIDIGLELENLYYFVRLAAKTDGAEAPTS
jgi:redox-sensing transcriptional repressor